MASKQVHKVAEQKKAPVSANAAKTSKDVKKEEKDLKKDEKQPGKAVKELPKDSKDPKKMEKDAKQSESVQSRGGHGRSRPEERNRSRERGRHSRDDRTNQRGQEKEVCRNFLHGRCDRGVLCKFSHPRSNSRGRSTDSGRQRSPVHAPGRNDNTDRVVCRDFVRNMCKRGDECRFYHPPNPENKRQRSSWLTFCHDFQNGHCSRSDCRLVSASDRCWIDILQESSFPSPVRNLPNMFHVLIDPNFFFLSLPCSSSHLVLLPFSSAI